MTEIKNIYSEPFLNSKNAFSFLLENGNLTDTKQCSKCSSTSRILKTKRRKDGYAYICTNQQCKKVVSISCSFQLETKVMIHLLLRVIYCFVCNYDNSQAVSICEVSEPLYIKIKKYILQKIKKINQRDNKVGGLNVEVQLDETAICNGRIISDPSNEMDGLDGVQWIFGGVVKGRPSELFMKLVPNRRKETILRVMREFIKRNSIIVTDGYPSYPPAVHDFESVHIIVNHSEGFRNNDGYTTNYIENVWSHFKTEYRSRHGLPHSQIELFIEEFVFRKKHLLKKTELQKKAAFLLLVNKLI